MNDSQKYMAALSEGNNAVILEIYQHFFPKIKSFVFNNKGNEDDAKDIFHDALIYLMVKHKESPLQIASFEAYFFTICKNQWRSKLKKRKIRVMPEEIVYLKEREIDQASFILEQRRLEFYQEKFQLLSTNCKEVLANYFNGMSYDEILKDLAYSSINTVRQRVFKCRSKLAQLIKGDKRYHTLVA